jgi:hypothetical protein
MNPVEQTRLTLKAHYPNLNDDFVLHSRPTDSYNCIAFAVRENNQWWCPFARYPRGFWPPTAKKDMTVSAYVAALGWKKFVQCDDDKMEDGYEKIALYVKDARPTHASRQLADGRWASKLGWGWDIIHNEPKCVENSEYGQVAMFLKRVGQPVDPLSPTLV